MAKAIRLEDILKLLYKLGIEGGIQGMNSNKPFIHLFRTPKGYYVYDVNSDTMLSVTKDTYLLLEEDKTLENEEIKRLKSEGFLLEDRFEGIVHPEDKFIEYHLDSRVKMMTLQVTQQCNLRCKYCMYSGGYENREHTNKRMSFSMAKKGIDFLISHSRNVNDIIIGFYGGEPLLEFNLIKKCVEYAMEVSEGKKILFSMTTNATLLNDEIVDFLEEYNFNVMVSIDGPRETHNKNRIFAFNKEGSFDIVMENLEKIKNNYPEFFKRISFNAVLDPNNDLGCINEFFTTYDVIKDSFINVSTLNPNYTDKDTSVTEQYNITWNYETFKMFLSKIGRLEPKYTSKIVNNTYNNIKRFMHDARIKLPGVHLKGKGHPGGPCVPGVQRLFMNVDGNFYPCERVSENSCNMKIGNIDDGFDVEAIRNVLNIGSITESQCKNCWAFRYCSLCAAYADTSDEFSAEKKLKNCARVRHSTEELMKDYCTLKELGCSFEEDA